jgi:hypothetical protein
MSRRRGSAIALKASEVVAALAMQVIYILIWEYVKINFFPFNTTESAPRLSFVIPSGFCHEESAFSARIKQTSRTHAVGTTNSSRVQAPALPLLTLRL